MITAILQFVRLEIITNSLPSVATWTMTKDNLLKFLGNREYLYQVSYQELKSLVVQYPYSLSLRYLLAMKSMQEDNRDHERNVELLSTYGIDRAHFYDVFSETPIVLEDLEESVLMGEDFLELKELSTLERELETSLSPIDTDALTFTSNQQEYSPKQVDLIETNISDRKEEVEIESPEIPGEAVPDADILASDPEENNPVEIFNDGLPPDAVEINDYISSQQSNELEEEIIGSDAILEEAVSDSSSYHENPEELLDLESKSALKDHEDNELTNSPQFVTENTDIPFEVVTNLEESVPTLEEQEVELNDIEESTTKQQASSLAPRPKSSFSSWKNQFSSIGEITKIDVFPFSNIGKPSIRIIKRKKRLGNPDFEKTVEFAAESLKMGTDIASETLASLLEEQGHYHRAKEMYQKLCLIMPEKNAYFVSKIEQLKNLSDESP